MPAAILSKCILRVKLLEKDLGTLTEKPESTTMALGEIEDLRMEMKGPRMFLNGAHLELKSELPEIMKKLTRKG